MLLAVETEIGVAGGGGLNHPTLFGNKKVYKNLVQMQLKMAMS